MPPTLVFLHGFPDHKGTWFKQLSYFQDQCQTVALDLPGFNTSPASIHFSDYEIGYVADQLLVQITQLSTTEIVLVGHDWGGILASVMAEKQPHLITKLILINSTHPTFFAHHLAHSWKQKLKSYYAYLFQMPWLPEIFLYMTTRLFFRVLLTTHHREKNPDFYQSYLVAYSRLANWRAALNYYRNFFRHLRVWRVPIPISQQTPTLVIWGTHDSFLDDRLVELMRQHWYGPTEFKVIENGGHWVHLRQAETVNQTISEFLTQ
ncbi:MAG TPA: alpha/beta hydrolase [Vitreimonas sp.]|nr:alpha/beta hydrolase [Vitreimonas sp.]